MLLRDEESRMAPAQPQHQFIYAEFDLQRQASRLTAGTALAVQGQQGKAQDATQIMLDQPI